MSNTRVGVVGVGHLGYHHGRIYAALDGVDLVGIVDTEEAQGQKAAEDFGAPWFKTVEELLAAGVDCASVAAPTSAHCTIAQQLLEGGVDVLVEKPIAATLEEGQAMVDTADKAGRLLQVGHIERFNGAVMAFMEAIKAPRFIECHRMSPYPMRGHDVSVVHDLMIHDLEILLALDPSGVDRFDASGVAVLSPSEDIASVRVHFNSGCVANVTASRISLERMRKIRIFEENAYVSTDYSEQQVMVYRKKPGEMREGMNPMELIAMDPLEVKKEEPLKVELEAFIECVQQRSRPLVAGEDGLAALRLAQDIVAQIRELS